MSVEADTARAAKLRRVALIGNPNTGKTTLFNALTGLSHRIGNYPGVTVEKKTGTMGESVELIDLPGTYSLAAHSPDEQVAIDVLTGSMVGEARPDLIVVIVDASNLQRNLYLLTQIMELGLPVIVALNMMDIAAESGVRIDVEGLSGSVGVPFVPLVASRGKGVGRLREQIESADGQAPQPGWDWPGPLQAAFDEIAGRIDADGFLLRRALIDAGGAAEAALLAKAGDAAQDALDQARGRLKEAGAKAAALEAQMRYAWIARATAPHLSREAVGPTRTERIDAVLTHRVFGTIAFVAMMSVVFASIFSWAAPVMNLCGSLFEVLGDAVSGLFEGTRMAGGPLQSLLADGVIAGVGGVLVFLPQILLLFLFIAILEDCGYMARAAFLMDRLLRFCGLSGHSFIPLMSSFACAIPGIMAARTIRDRRDRIATILVAPLMSCSARIPIYAIMIAAFVPATYVGFLPLQGIVFAAMYFVGILTAIPVAFILKKTLLKGPTPTFLMELPTYKMPQFWTVLLRVYQAGKAFIIRAGSIILVMSIVIWALGYFPRPDSIAVEHEARRVEVRAAMQGGALEQRLAEIGVEEQGDYLRQSALGRMGAFVEPAFAPMGWNWKIAMATIASFPAREIIVSTLGVIYDLGGDVDFGKDSDQTAMIERMNRDVWSDGTPVYNLPVALSIMVFFALCCQCGATLATMKRETNTWKWPIITFVYMTVLAYVAAALTYQIGMAFGLDAVGV